MGVIDAGTAVGAVIAPPLIALILSFMNWRWIIVISGVLGLFWTAWWRLSHSSSGARC
jgi:MFS transporter, ACS family, hexuronate transporter